MSSIGTLQKTTIKKFIPYVIAIVLFYLVTVIYFLPLIQGKRINQSDIIHYKGASKEIADYRLETGNEALWTNSMFGGMPAFQISVGYQPTILTYLQRILKAELAGPSGAVFLYFIGFFILLLVLRINPWLAIIGAFAYGFSSYFFIIIEAGHNTKALAIAYMAPVIAGIVLAYRGKWLWGFIITSIFLGLEIKANHYQITYYLLIVVIIYGIFELVDAFRNKAYVQFFKSTSVLLLASIIAVLLNLPGLWSTYEYSKQTIRGKSELSKESEKVSSGLDKAYVTQWSYGIQETLSLIIPNAKGGATRRISDNKQALQKVENQWKRNVGNQNHYWGNQPFTSGPVYVGSIIFFLFIFGLFVVKGKYKWILLSATILSILLSWGKNFMPLTDLFLDYVPLYNKFRAVTMTLVIAELCIPLLAILALNQIIKKPEIIQIKKKQLYISLGLTGGLLLILYLFPTSILSFISDVEHTQFNRLKQSNNVGAINQFIKNIEVARIHIFRVDTLRSLFYIISSFILLSLFGLKKIKVNLLLLIIGIFIMTDMISICRRYLNDDNYVRKITIEKPFPLSISNKEILKDDDIFRVFNITGNPFQETATSYYHQSIGGYSAAKLHRYQDLIENNIIKEESLLKYLSADLSNNKIIEDIFTETPVLNMLNTKYVILNPNQKPLTNPHVLGNAWFVSKYYTVKDANEELNSLDNIDPASEAVFDIKFRSQVENRQISFDPNAEIILTAYKPNHLVYQSEAKSVQFAVFSEIYYENGWNAYIDGKKTEYFRANYVLRAMIVPAGKHQIEFKFEPKSYFLGNTISMIASLIMILSIIGLVVFKLMKAKNKLVDGKN